MRFRYEDFPPQEADELLRNQKLMSPGQKAMCKNIRFLVWVDPPRKKVRRRKRGRRNG